MHSEEALAELAARMEEREVFFLEAFPQQEGHRQCVAEGESGGR